MEFYFLLCSTKDKGQSLKILDCPSDLRTVGAYGCGDGCACVEMLGWVLRCGDGCVCAEMWKRVQRCWDGYACGQIMETGTCTCTEMCADMWGRVCILRCGDS